MFDPTHIFVAVRQSHGGGEFYDWQAVSALESVAQAKARAEDLELPGVKAMFPLVRIARVRVEEERE